MGRLVGLPKLNSSVAKMICFNNANFKQLYWYKASKNQWLIDEHILYKTVSYDN